MDCTDNDKNIKIKKKNNLSKLYSWNMSKLQANI